MNKNLLKQMWKMIFILLPGVIGFYGLMITDQGTILDCAYKSLQLYFINYPVADGIWNWALEVSRWTAPIATAAVVLNLIFSLVENIRLWFSTKFSDTIAVHGDSVNIDLVVQKLGQRAVRSDKKMIFRAGRHILMFQNDFDMYRFIDEHGKQLLGDGNKRLYLCSEHIMRGSYENVNLVVCNMAENCARDYWERYPLKHDREKILIIGFENYGQRLLTQAILKNVLSTDSQIEYHVVGDYQGYLSKHYKLHKAVHVKQIKETGEAIDYVPYDSICDNQDTVYFYDVPWTDVLNRDVSFDRIILAYDTDAQNLNVLNELKVYYVNPVCYIKFTDRKILETLWDLKKENIIPYGIDEDMYEPDIILKEKLFDYAKMIHARYYAKWQCDGICNHKPCENKNDSKITSLRRCAQCQKLLEDWNKQTSFIRYSNVAQADHMEEKLRLLLGGQWEDGMLEREGIGRQACEAYAKLSYEEQKNLWQIEHIRWNRYHFMNNWDYNEKRDNPNRKHHLLVPFEALSKKEQEKDADAYLALEELLR